MEALNKKLRFSTTQEARMLPAPDKSATSPYIDYRHETQAGLFVRVMKPDAQSRVRRLWVHRYKVNAPDGNGGVVKHDRKISLGFVQAFEGEVAMPLEQAMQKVLNTRADTKSSRFESGHRAQRLTVAAAWEHYDIENANHRQATREKDQATFVRYFSHFKDKYLDELPYAFWSRFQYELLNQKVRVGERLTATGGTESVYVGPVSAATMRGIINVGVTLYELAARYDGLWDVDKDYNPAREAKKRLAAPNKKTEHIPLKDLGLAWRAAEQFCAPWWSDLFQCYVLTGLRRSLMVDMRFDQIDWERGVYLIDPNRRGTKRRGSQLAGQSKKGKQKVVMIELPLCQHVLSILKARQEFAPDKAGWVWYASRPLRGSRNNKEQRLSDPRSSWVMIEAVLGGLHFGAHDLRRTFATAGGACAADLFALSLLLLHSPATVAKEVGVATITLEYINTAEAQTKMRTAAEQISTYVRRLVADSAAAVPTLEPQLPSYIESALKGADAGADEEAEAEAEVA